MEFIADTFIKQENGEKTKFNNNSLLSNFDAQAWAQAFMSLLNNKPNLVIDRDLMVSWFAASMMTGYDEHARQHPELKEEWNNGYDAGYANAIWDEVHPKRKRVMKLNIDTNNSCNPNITLEYSKNWGVNKKIPVFSNKLTTNGCDISGSDCAPLTPYGEESKTREITNS